MVKSILTMMLVLAGSSAFADTFTCSCKVQTNGGDEATATSSNVTAASQSAAEDASSDPCKQTAIAKLQFLTPFSDPQLVWVKCEAGGAGNFH